MTKMMSDILRIYRRFQSKGGMKAIWIFFAMVVPFCAQAGYDRDEYLQYCKAETFDKKYEEAGCWSCDVIFSLMQSLTGTAGHLFFTMLELSQVILTLGAAIWLAVYFLKSLSSMAAQDPAKVIDGVLTFMFKWALVFALINLGINEVIDRIVNPILSIGFDIGTEFYKSATF